jgi:tetratricopeptide (TPR) repeat protein
MTTASSPAAFLAYWQSHYGQAEALAQEGHTLSCRAGDAYTRAQALRVLGEVASERGQRERAAVLLEESLALFRTWQDRWGIAAVLNDLGILATDEGDYTRAGAVLEECLTLHRQVGEKNRIAAALSYLGDVATYQGDYLRALALNEESLALAQTLDSGSRARSLLHLGLSLREVGDLARARRALQESLSLHRERSNRGAIAWCLEGLAGVACAEGLPAQAARLFAAADALREAIGFPVPVGRRGRRERDMTAAREALGEAAFMSLWESGRCIALDRVVADLAVP